jgi:transcription-repair coupling factor (superfamily II helicase)
MRRELTEILDDAAATAPFERLLGGGGRTVHVPAAGHPFAAAVLARALNAPVLAVAADPRAADELAASASAFLDSDAVVRFPAWESLPYEGMSPSPGVASARARAAHLVRHASGPLLVVAPVLAVLQGLPPDLGAHEPLRVASGQTHRPQALAAQLSELGYARADVVEHRGEFAVRGGIVDFFPATARRPVRVDFWGDEVESVREFSPATQLSTDKLDAVEVHPAMELLVSEDVQRAVEDALPRYRGHFRAVLERLAQGMAFEGMEQAVPLIYDRLPFLTDLMPGGSWVLLAGARRISDRARHIVEEADALAEASGWPGHRAVFELDRALGSRPRVDLSEFAEPDLPDLGMSPWEQPTRLDALTERLAEVRKEGGRVVVAAEGRGSLERAVEVLSPSGLNQQDLITVEAAVAEGFVFRPEPEGPALMAVATEEDLFGRRRHTREAPRLSRRRSEAVAVELSPGDLAVHQVHGVGRYVGMVRRAVAGSERDYLLLEYAAGDKLYVPSDQVGVVAKYVGGEAPRLHRLGSGDWVKAKGRVRRAVRDMAADLMRLL